MTKSFWSGIWYDEVDRSKGREYVSVFSEQFHAETSHAFGPRDQHLVEKSLTVLSSTFPKQ